MRSDISVKLRQDVINRYGEKCYICGADHLLGIVHLIPMVEGGDNSVENLRLICKRCHIQVSSGLLKHLEFESYLYELLKLSKEFSGTIRQKIIGEKGQKKRIDLYTTSGNTKYYIETKALSFIDDSKVMQVINQLKFYREDIDNGVLVFAFPGILPKNITSVFRNANIEVWDIPFIANKFKDEIPNVPHTVFQSLFGKYAGNNAKSSKENFITKLTNIKPGKGEWNIYQKLMRDILETLFCPPLSNPLYELSDEYNVNRRDFILPNYSENGFWLYIRSMYYGDFIVIDAKNYTKKVQKKDVLQIANYLKSHGAGLFGIILTRNGGDRSCFHTIREIWAIHKKLIIILDDEDIKQMLMLHSAGHNPEDVLKQKIEEFRLSL